MRYLYYLYIYTANFMLAAIAKPAYAIGYGDLLILQDGCDTIGGCIRVIIEFVTINIVPPVAVIFILYAGFLFVTAQGNDQKLTKAKETIWWTVIGIAIAVGALALAFAFENFFKGIGKE